MDCVKSGHPHLQKPPSGFEDSKRTNPDANMTSETAEWLCKYDDKRGQIGYMVCYRVEHVDGVKEKPHQTIKGVGRLGWAIKSKPITFLGAQVLSTRLLST